MESDELEAPENAREPSRNGGLESAPSPPERARRLRRFAIQVDSHSSLLSATRRLRRQLPGDEQFGDPLSTAGAEPVEVLGRTVSSLQPDRKSVLQELGFAGLQVWQSLSEAAGRGRGTQEMAVMFTDLAGFSSWALKAGDEPALALLREVGTRVETTVVRHEGRIVKRLGDGVMATFLSPQAALQAALDAQDEVGEIEIDGYRPSMRVGVHWGSPRKLGGDYLGVDVNIAARVGDAAKPGQVLVSDALLSRVDAAGLHTGRSKRLRADGTPRDLHVVRVSRD
ncbi:MAG TPA: adenylate/guanylate cyclase domain-containing protein [Solirubrobacteraceae bacterium]|jgi:adenylate cyclase|nr:adenylate/guanylate cyclase domain-containing protein [Solirubrobacteraceae bacterium]